MKTPSSMQAEAGCLEGEHRCPHTDVASTPVLPVVGRPAPERMGNSIVERQNLTIRMRIRRLTRPTSGFSKKCENPRPALALHFAYYNFCRIHRTIRVTPAMETGIADRAGTLTELLEQ
jgi:hypothetical protein